MQSFKEQQFIIGISAPQLNDFDWNDDKECFFSKSFTLKTTLLFILSLFIEVKNEFYFMTTYFRFNEFVKLHI